MKIHIWSIIKYIIGFLLLIVFIMIFKQDFLVFLLFPYIILPAGLLPVFIIYAKKTSVTGHAQSTMADKGNSIVFYVEYDNPTYLPYLKCILTFSVKNMYYENDKKNVLNFCMLPKRKERINISVDTSRTGMAVFEGYGLTITDFLGFISIKIPVEFCVQVPVFPVVSGNEADTLKTPYSEGYDEYAEPDMKGSLSSDIKEIREYRPGDRLARIHWKLTAKLEELQVKEMERTSVMSLVIVPELEREAISETVDMLDKISRSLIENGERFEICLYNDKACDFSYFVIDNTESLLECEKSMFFLPLYTNGGAAKEAYYASHQKSSLILIIHGEKMSLLEDGAECGTEPDNYRFG